MNRINWGIAKRLIFEQRYQSLKGNSSFISRFSGGKGGRSLRSFIIANYMASVFSFALLSLSLTFVRLLSQANAGLSELELLLFFYVYTANIFNAIFFLDGVVSENLLQPVSSLPLEEPGNIIPESYMLYYGSSSVFVIIPFLLLELVSNHSILMFVFGILWMLVYIVFGYLSGALIFHYLYRFRNPAKPSVMKNAGTLFRVFVIVLIFSFFEIWVYDPQVLPASFTPAAHGILFYFIPILNSPILVNAHITAHGILWNIISIVSYTAVLFLIYKLFHMRLFRNLLLPEQKIKNFTGDSKFSANNPKFSLYLKNIRIVLRKTQYSLMLFFPVMVAIPFAVPLILSNAASDSYNPLGLYYALLTIPVICASIYSLISFISEGNAISLYFILPDMKRSNVLSKSKVGISIFSCIVFPLTLFIMSTGHYTVLEYLLVPLNLVVGFSFAYLNLLRRFSGKLSPQITMVNIDTFGGSIGLLISFGFVLIQMLGPVIIGALITEMVYSNSGSTVTLLIDFLINAAFLVISLLLYFQTSDTKHRGRLYRSSLAR